MAIQHLLNVLRYTATETDVFDRTCTFTSASITGLYPRCARSSAFSSVKLFTYIHCMSTILVSDKWRQASDGTEVNICSSVYINQRDATLLMNDLYYPLIGSTCFGLSPVHHQERHLINCMTHWYVRAIKRV